MSARLPAIAIIGAGIGGLAVAAGLRQRNIPVVVYEQASTFGPVGAGIQLTPNATKVLRGLGLEASLRRDGFAPRAGLNREWDTGRINNVVEMGLAIERKYGSPDLAMHRSRLHAALASLLLSDTVRLNKKLVGLDRINGKIRLSFSDGEHADADGLIGADGLHSEVRKCLFGSGSMRFTGQVGYRAVLPTSRVTGVEIDERVKWWGPDRHVVSYFTTPNKDEIYYIAATPEPDFKIESWSEKGNIDVLLAAFANFHPQILSVLQATPDVRKWALVDRDPLPQWGDGEIVLIGDACHPMPPYLAQGAASALEDAAVLSRCLDGRGVADIAAAFRRFEAARKDRATQIQTRARQNTWLRDKTEADWIWAYDVWDVVIAP
jgi:6-hydroxynicotinate 3-monooxygenase